MTTSNGIPETMRTTGMYHTTAACQEERHEHINMFIRMKNMQTF